MLLTLAIIWTLVLGVFLVVNKRWEDSMARLDAAMEQAAQQRLQLHAKHGRKYGH